MTVQRDGKTWAGPPFLGVILAMTLGDTGCNASWASSSPCWNIKAHRVAYETSTGICRATGDVVMAQGPLTVKAPEAILLWKGSPQAQGPVSLTMRGGCRVKSPQFTLQGASLTYLRQTHTVTLQHNVVLQYEHHTLTAQTLHIGLKNGASPASASPSSPWKSLTALGAPRWTYKDTVMTAHKLTYNAAAHTLTAWGHVRLQQGKNIMTGDLCTLDLTQQKAVFSAPNSTRVRGIFHPTSGKKNVFPKSPAKGTP